MTFTLLRPSNYKQVAPLVRTGGSRHTGLAALPHRNIHPGRKGEGQKQTDYLDISLKPVIKKGMPYEEFHSSCDSPQKYAGTYDLSCTKRSCGV